MSKTQYLANQINFNILTYYFTTPGLTSINFVRFKDPMHIYNVTKNDNILIGKVEED